MLRKKINKEIFENKRNHIPHGKYCYDANTSCPFWELDTSKQLCSNGFCHLLKKGDWEENLNVNNNTKGNLWDCIKECNINTEHLLLHSN
ncbi:MAG: hypothetical protein K0R54_676 [Clostridiaceae bacterium]|nr:hypothetical protein [Clostridiaceae bacterium]